jgi:sugar transferase (PEP-CTERM system associated)
MVRLLGNFFPLNTLLLVAVDAIGLFFAIVFGYMMLYPGGNAELLKSIPGATAIVLAMVIVTGSLGLYRDVTPSDFWPKVVRVALAFAVILPGLHWIFYRLPDGSVCLPCLGGTMALGFIAKLSIFMLSHASPLRQRRVMVLGVGADAVAVKETLERSRSTRISVIGFYSPYAEHTVDAALPSSKILCSSRSIGEITGQHNINEIVIAMRERRGGTLPLKELLNCKLKGVKVTDLSAFYEQHRSRVRIDLLRESWFIFGDGFRQGRVRMFVKRAFDILASAVLLILSAPVMLIAAIAVKLESPGPVIYRQERVGLGGRSFNIMKFRSMRADAEKNGPQWAQAGDSRVTRVGRFMRLTRIDELPQLFSVLAGTMSLVGPRPERPYFVKQLEEQIPFYSARHSVKPGVTGWAQVRHKYGASIDDSSDKLEYDLFYVKNHTLIFDILVLFHSVKVVLTAQGSR